MAKALLGLLLLLGQAVGAQEGTTVRSLEHQGATRTARFHLGKKATATPALVLVLHAEGSNAAFIERLSGLSELADEEGFLAVYPESWARHWNDGRGSEAYPAPTAEVDDVAYLRDLIGLALKEYKVDPSRIFVCGLSNGGMMALRLAVEDPQEVAAVACVAGLLPVWARQVPPVAPPSALFIVGTQDPIVPYGGGPVRFLRGRARGEVLSSDETIAVWIKGTSGAEAPLDDPDKNDGCKPFRQSWKGTGSEVVRIRIEGGGHGWPSAPQALPVSLIGSVCQDFEAKREIWSFFQTHHR